MYRLLFFLCGCVVLVSSSCSARYYMKRGNVLHETGRYYKAASKYEKAYNRTKSKEFQGVMAMRAGEEYERVNRLKEAHTWYRRSQRADKEKPEVYLKLAHVSVRMGDTLMARRYYSECDSLFGDTRGGDGVYYVDQLMRDMQQRGRYAVELKRDFNSRGSDFAPVYLPGDTCTVYFASTRKGDPKKKRQAIDPVTGDGFSHIFKAAFVQEVRTTDKNGRVKVKKFKEPRWLQPVLQRDSLYSNRHEGGMCFSPDGTILYFTSSRPLKGGHAGTRIYKATRKAADNEESEEAKAGGWMEVTLAGVCGDTVSVGHPALTPDGGRLYFVTDVLPGGFGGKDIWYVEERDGRWGEPVNAGELVNSAGNELFPMVRDNGELYFASDGHFGFGGLDLYKIENRDGKEVRVHLPAPLNSNGDDFGIAFKPGEDKGIFTSGRSGKGDDIFSFEYLPQQLRVHLAVVNTITELPVHKAEVTVTVDDGEVIFLETDSLGMATMPVVAEKDYIFVASHPQYLKGKGEVSTYREKSDRLYELKVNMQPIEKPIVIPNIYFDVAKWDLRPDAMKNLEELLHVLRDNPNIVIELSAHTDMVGNDRANMILSENRAQAVVDYLIQKGVYWDRLVAKGYGKSMPRQINEKDAREYPFLKTGDVLDHRLVGKLTQEQRETARQLNRRIEFKVLRTNYKPGPQSLHNPNQKAVAVEEGHTMTLGQTQLRALGTLKGRFYTLQLGVFKNVPAIIDRFRVVFTDRLPNGAVRYCTGIYDTREDADKAAADLKKKGIDCFVREYDQ